jgi:osmotically-inducible protein OsmY
VLSMKHYRSYCAFIGLFVILAVLGTGIGTGSEGPTDSQITAWVQEQVSQDPRINPGKVEVATHSGIVTLGGTVPTLAGKSYADLESKRIRGVRGVINEIIVSPVLRSDKEISQDVRRRFQNSADLNQSAVAAESLEGKVFLSGKVDSWSKREQAEFLAAGVRGVMQVVDEVQVQHKEARGDDEIEKDVTSTMNRDVYLCGLPIRVSVVAGVVTLQGSVTRPYEKDRASFDSMSVSSVKKVDNRLRIVGGETPIREKAPRPSDDELRRSIRDELAQDLRMVSPYELDIEVINGNVTLRGLVWSPYERRLAIEDTRDVVGVGRVEDLLTVWPELREDRAVRDDIQFEMGLDSVLNSQDLGIRVAGGIVTLTGKVDTFYRKLHAGEVASRVRGVREVVNAIHVTGAPMFSDAAVRDAVKRRLEANTLTGSAADRISVKVEKGRATLAGEVDTGVQYREAARVALLTKGVRSLDNRLNLAGGQFH